MAPYSVKILPVGQLATNCYIVWDRGTLDAMIIDPGDDAEYISETLTKLKVYPRCIVSTHGHFDHVLSVFALESMYNIPFFIHPDDDFLLANMKKSASYYLHIATVDPPPKNRQPLMDGHVITLGSSNFTVIGTPGHTPGSVCLYEPKHAVLFTGDTIFAEGAVGRTDRSYGNRAALTKSLARLFALPEQTAIFPGHGAASTLGSERKFHVV